VSAVAVSKVVDGDDPEPLVPLMAPDVVVTDDLISRLEISPRPPD
jgi:hypothetical protein